MLNSLNPASRSFLKQEKEISSFEAWHRNWTTRLREEEKDVEEGSASSKVAALRMSSKRDWMASKSAAAKRRSRRRA